MSEDFWPQDLLDNIPRTPKTILEEQAAALGPKTKNIVQAKVKSAIDPEGDFHHSFVLTCNALGTYQYTLFVVWHGVSLYPVHHDNLEFEDEYEFKRHLKDILGTPRTAQMVRALVAQAQGVKAADDDVPF